MCVCVCVCVRARVCVCVQMHMVGLNNGSYEQPWLRAIHGPSELVTPPPPAT